MDTPCDHWENLVGTVAAGDPHSGPFVAVATCAACATRSAGFVQMKSGLPAGDLLTYDEARRRSAR